VTNEKWQCSEVATGLSTVRASTKIVGLIDIAFCERGSILHFAFFICHFALLTLQFAVLTTLASNQKASRNTGCGWLISQPGVTQPWQCLRSSERAE
jgi:hypothetical protein